MTLSAMGKPFAALRYRDFKLLWTSGVLNGGGQQMETVVVGWYVLQLTNSPFLVGLVTAARLAMTVLGALTGALADRMSRKLVLLSVQSMLTVSALIMFTLIATQHLQIWHIFAVSLIGGLGRIFDMPARAALMADTVAPAEVPNSVALNQAAMNVTQIIAPIAAGAAFKFLGPSGSYAVIAGVYATSLTATTFLSVERRIAPALGTVMPSVWRTMIEGLSYARRDSIIMAALMMAAIANLTGFPFNQTVMPVFAKNVLHTDSTGLGFLLAGIGVGALTGSIVLASRHDLRYAGRWMVAGMVGWHLSAVAVAFAPTFAIAFALLVLVGLCQSVSLVTISAVLLGKAPTHLRGRVMGLRQLAVYTLAFGSSIDGALAGAWGVPLTVLATSAVGIVLIGGLFVAVPKLGGERPGRNEPAKAVA